MSRKQRPWFQKYWLTFAVVSGLVSISTLLIILGVWGSHQLTQDKRPEFIAKLVGTATTAVGGVVLFLNFRNAQENTRLAEERFDAEVERSFRESQLATSRLLAERFSTAIEQLGNNQTTIHIGGIYSLEKLSVDYPQEYYKTVMEVLTSFIREKASIEFSQSSQTISENIQAALTVIGRRDVHSCQTEKTEYILNLSRSDLKGANLRGASLINVNFEGSNLRGADLRQANLSNTKLVSTDLRDATIDEAVFQLADVRSANIKGAREIDVNRLASARNWEKIICDDHIRAKLESLSNSEREETI